jgi:hypothetical protein
LSPSSHSVRVYGQGVFACSVCAPTTMTIEAIIADVELQYPSGTERGWHKSDDTHFASGLPNPHPCREHHTEERQHWLLEV